MIAHNSPWITEEDIFSVERTLRTGWVAPGPEVKILEGNFKNFYGGGHATALSSGTASLFLALRALGARQGVEVALPTYACSALLNAIHMAGATPKVIDVTPDAFVLDIELLKQKAPNAEIVIAVHTYGAKVDVDGLKNLNLKVIEDCCQSLGGFENNQPLGCEGDISVFSFYATKIITGGHGGLVWSRNSEYIGEIIDYREFDCREKYYPRFNFQLTDIQAAMVNSQFKRLPEILSRRNNIAKLYIDSLPESLSVQSGLVQTGRMAYRFVVKSLERKGRDSLQEHLEKSGISTIVPVSRQELLHNYLGLDCGEFPVAEKLVDTTLSLPIYPAMEEKEIAYICKKLREF